MFSSYGSPGISPDVSCLPHSPSGVSPPALQHAEEIRPGQTRLAPCKFPEKDYNTRHTLNPKRILIIR
jgi:hypothetical protein